MSVSSPEHDSNNIWFVAKDIVVPRSAGDSKGNLNIYDDVLNPPVKIKQGDKEYFCRLTSTLIVSREFESGDFILKPCIPMTVNGTVDITVRLVDEDGKLLFSKNESVALAEHEDREIINLDEMFDIRGQARISDQEYRLSICAVCPSFDDSNGEGICTECGCFMRSKVAELDATCPLDKWDLLERRIVSNV